MKLPRDISGEDLLQALARLGYRRVRQRGSHVSAITVVGGEHHITIPLHDPVKPGTLNGILRDVATHHGLARQQLLAAIFG